MRVGIYARFSSELQSTRSIEDQSALCRAYADRQQWTVAEIYADHAVSGASVHGRFAFERMVIDARRGALDLILTEDLDRLSRNQADIAALHERMVFAGVEIWTVADGRVSEMHVGLKGTMSALFLKNLALKTHRGLAGRIRAGKSAGGRCYGYRVGKVGERTIEPAEAAIVRRIFAETVAGRSPREIVARLNREEVPGPRGGAWNASTLNGSRRRANGILHNELYIGKLIWNRQRFIKDPDTGKRVSRVNAEGARQVVELPELRIIEPAVWEAVRAILAGRANGPRAQARAPRHLLSGLCRCGACGGSYVVAAPNQLGCSTRREKGTCDNRRMIARSIVEARILEALEGHLLHEDVIAAAAAEYLEERKRLKANAAGERRKRDRRLGEVSREIERIVDALIAGSATKAVIARLPALEAEKEALAATPLPEPEVVEFHPAIVSRYQALVRTLRAELAAAPAEDKTEVIASVRHLVDRVVIYPRNDAKGRDLELHGSFAALLGDAEQGRKGMGALVAGTRFGRSHTLLRAVVIPVRSRSAA